MPYDVISTHISIRHKFSKTTNDLNQNAFLCIIIFFLKYHALKVWQENTLAAYSNEQKNTLAAYSNEPKKKTSGCLFYKK